MAKKNRLFISFAVEDASLRDLLVGQAKLARSPFEFVDMSVKEPWSDQWKANCRIRIKGCDGVLLLVSRNTASATGALWEVSCAKEEGIPVRGLFCTSDNRPTPPDGVRTVSWTWDNIATFIDSL